MIGMLRGEVYTVNSKALVLDVQGVGYDITPSLALSASVEIGQQLKLVVFTDVKQDAIRLYGFVDQLEREVFKLLMMVKGIGAKSALDVISKIDKLDLLRIIAAADLSALQRVKGIGKKTAERILVELKDTVGKYIVEAPSEAGASLSNAEPFEEAAQALLALGFTRKQVDGLIANVRTDNSGVGDKLEPAEIVRLALRRV